MLRLTKCIDTDDKITFSHWEKDLAEEILAGIVIVADSLEELADKLGFDKEKFLSFMEKHNTDVAEGRTGPMGSPPQPNGDDDEKPNMPIGMFNMPKAHPLESGPFYAVFQKIFHENSMGGMSIDENTSVLKDSKPIPGLYAAGDNTRGIMLPGDLGMSFVDSFISPMTYAMCSGYISAVEASEYSVRD